MLPVNIQPSEEITLTLTYEYLLERSDNLYTHALSISPGEIVPDFQIRMVVTENRPLANFAVVSPAIGDVTDQAVDFLTSGEASVNFTLSTNDQFNFFGKHGFTGNSCIILILLYNQK